MKKNAENAQLKNSLKRLPFHFAKRHGVFIAKIDEQGTHIVCRTHLDPQILIELRRFIEGPLHFKEVSEEEFANLLAAHYESGTNTAMELISGMAEDLDLSEVMSSIPVTEDLLEIADEAPIIRLINALLTQAIKQHASDVHFEIFADRLVVRYRIDGILREVLQPPRVLASLVTSRLKIMAKLDIAEKRLPQDGRIALNIAGRAIDVRVSTIPTHYGERIVLRLLDKQSAPLDLQRLGMSQNVLNLMRQLIAKPHGIILVTGPTGSGKTTTLYAALTELNDTQRNILTTEDPIEYYLPGIGQTQVSPKIGMTFARGLRAILRQDPDVVMVGEIRDMETVEMAIQASLTGHLVFSTLHTNSAIGAITRLRDMGAEPFLLASTISGVLAQRLIRTLCHECKQPKKTDEKEQLLLGIKEPLEIYIPHGCPLCGESGYRGRTGIYELVAIDERLRTMIHDNASEAQMEKYSRELYPSMRHDGWQKVLTGITTIEEVLRVTAEE